MIAINDFFFFLDFIGLFYLFLISHFTVCFMLIKSVCVQWCPCGSVFSGSVALKWTLFSFDFLIIWRSSEEEGKVQLELNLLVHVDGFLHANFRGD